jgi:hypothetical protein
MKKNQIGVLCLSDFSYKTEYKKIKEMKKKTLILVFVAMAAFKTTLSVN